MNTAAIAAQRTLFVAIAMACIGPAVAACGSSASVTVDDEASWARATQLPASDTLPPPLLDCSDPEGEGALCTDEPHSVRADAIETTCRELAESAETAFTGHRCLARLWRQRAIQVVVREAGNTTRRDADAAVRRTVEGARRGEKEALEAAHAHLAEAHAVAPDARGVLLHDVEVLTRLVQLGADVETRLEEAAEQASAAYDDDAALDHIRKSAARLLGEGDVANAERVLVAMAAARPDHVTTLRALAVVRLEADDIEGATRALDQALATEPETLGPYDDRMRYAVRYGDVDTAGEIFGTALQRLGLESLAESPLLLTWAWLEGAGDADGELAGLTRDRAEAGSKVGQILLDHAESLRRTDRGSRAELAMALVGVDSDAALAVANWVLEWTGGPFVAWMAQAQARRALGLEAGDALLGLIQRLEARAGGPNDATNAQVRFFTARILIDESRAHEALEVLRDLDHRNAKKPLARFLRARALAARGDVDAARELLRELADDPETGEIGDAARAALDDL